MADAATAHKRTLQQAGWSLSNVSFAFGLWPLGKTYTDKAPHETPQQFYQRLQIAFAAGSPMCGSTAMAAPGKPMGRTAPVRSIRNFQNSFRHSSRSRHNAPQTPCRWPNCRCGRTFGVSPGPYGSSNLGGAPKKRKFRGARAHLGDPQPPSDLKEFTKYGR